MTTIKTTLHHYYFDTTQPDQAKQYHAAVERARATGFPCWTNNRDFDTFTKEAKQARDYDKMISAAVARPERTDLHGGMGCGVFSAPIDLETDHLFSDQWNSAPIAGVSESGLRLFNWVENRYANKAIKWGYWLKQTEEMRAVLRDTLKCGYCGRQEQAASGMRFCVSCIDSEYLKEDQLYLTRLMPVSNKAKRPALSAEESAERVPLFRHAQIHGSTQRGIARIAKQRADVEQDYNDSIKEAENRRTAATWILDHVPGMYGNWIYYSHTNRHSFGWRNGLAADVAAELAERLKADGFPFAWDIEHADKSKTSSDK